MDRRNSYRAVSRMLTSGEVWKVQVWRWWWPIWMTVDDFNSTVERAREKAMNHAKKKSHVRRVVVFGRFPETNR